jgi:hypothetical protein
MNLILLGLTSIASLFGFHANMLASLATIMPVHYGIDPRISLVAGAALLPLVGLLTNTVIRTKSHTLYRALVSTAWDNSYLAGGEVFDVSAVFPNRAFGATRMACAVSTANCVACFVPGSSNSPSTCVIQLWQSTTGAPIALVEVANATDKSAITTDLYEVIGD